jgi:predicted component of type VI protein secretion system
VHTRSKHPEPTRDGLAHKQAAGAWLRLAKVAAPSQMPRLIRSALRGIALRALDEIPAELGADPEALVFALDTGDAHWPFIEQEGDMVLLPPPSGHDVLVEITILCLTEGHS